MEIDENIERYFSKTISVEYYDKPSRIMKGDLYCSITEISIQSKIDSKIRTEYIKYPDIQELVFNEQGKICIKQKEKLPTLTVIIENPIYLYEVIFIAFKYFFPSENVFQFISVKNELKLDLDSINEKINRLEINNWTPCNNFTRGIAFCAKSKGLVENDEIIWDIDTVYAAKETKRFVLKDFDHLNNFKKWFLWPVLCTLGYNTYFTEISLSFIDLNPYEKVLEHLFEYNRKIEKLEMAGSKLKVSGLSLIIRGLCHQTNLKYLDLSHNEQFGDNGAQVLSKFLEERGHKLEVFLMTDCNLISMSLNRIGNGFYKSVVGMKEQELNLRILDLSNNNLKESFDTKFTEFLMLCKKLEQLCLANMNTTFHTLANSVSSLHETLTILDLSGNIANPQFKSSVWSELFQNTKCLKSLNLSNFKITEDCIFQSLLIGLITNEESIQDLEVNLSNCNLKGKHFEEFIDYLPSIQKMSHLDLSLNDIGSEFELLIHSLPKLKNLKSLNFSGNLLNIKTKEMNKLLDVLSQCLQDECSLENLNLSNCNIGPTISVLINDIDCFFSIRKLDISGNNFGNIVGRCFGRMLAIDKHLQQVNIDNNGISKEIYEEILDNLQTNNTLDTFHVPFVDLNKCPSKAVTVVLEKINKHHQKMHRIYQGLTLDDIRSYSCDYQMINTLALLEKMKDDLTESRNRLKSMEQTDRIKDCLKRIDLIVAEIEMTKNVDSKLKKVLLKSEDNNINIETKTKHILLDNSKDLTKTINNYLENVIKNMLIELELIFPSLFEEAETDLKKDIIDKMGISMKFSDRYMVKLNDKFLQNNVKNKILEIHSILSEKAGDLIVDRLVDKARLLETSANRIIYKQTNLSSSDSKESGNHETVVVSEVQTRPNKTLKSSTISGHISRKSFLSANTARPMSFALKGSADITEEDHEEIENPIPAPRSPKPKLLPPSSLQRIDDDESKSMDDSIGSTENRISNGIDHEKPPIDKLSKPGVTKLKNPPTLLPISPLKHTSFTEPLISGLSDSTDELDISVAKKSRAKPPRTKKVSMKVSSDIGDEAVDKFLHTEISNIITEVPEKRGFFSKMKKKKTDVNLDNLGGESLDEDNEKLETKPRTMSSQPLKKKESSKLSKKISG